MRDTRQPAPMKRRASADQYALVQQTQSPGSDVDEVPDSYYSLRMPTSVAQRQDSRRGEQRSPAFERFAATETPSRPISFGDSHSPRPNPNP